MTERRSNPIPNNETHNHEETMPDWAQALGAFERRFNGRLDKLDGGLDKLDGHFTKLATEHRFVQHMTDGQNPIEQVQHRDLLTEFKDIFTRGPIQKTKKGYAQSGTGYRPEPIQWEPVEGTEGWDTEYRPRNRYRR